MRYITVTIYCRDVFSPARLHQLQTDYAQAMAPHGLTRGIKYSTAKHEDVRRYHGAQQMSKEQLTELARPLAIAAYQLPVAPERMTIEQYRQESQAAFNAQLGRLQTMANQKIEQLATVATANAHERERARVLEKRLASSQNLLVETRAELTTKTGTLTAQVQQAQQGLFTRTAELAEQKARADKANLQHFRAVMKHSQGEPLSEKLTAWGQEVRQTHQRRIEGELGKQLLKPLLQLTDMAPVFIKNSYVLEVVSPAIFTLTHEKNGMRFSSVELRPNGRDFLEQFREAVGKRRGLDQTGPSLSGEIEM